MNKIFIKTLCVIIILCAFNFESKVYAKYIITDTENIAQIKSADNEAPFINGRNYDVDYDVFQISNTVEYKDNLNVKSAKFWRSYSRSKNF
jgi:hypothetical protein